MRNFVRWSLLAFIWGGLALVGGSIAAQDDLPEVIRTLLEEAERHVEAERFDDAIANYLEARRLDPSVLAVYASLGAVYVAQGDLDKALEAFTAGLAAHPKDPRLLFNAAVVALRLERFAAALTYVERGLAEDRRNAELQSLYAAVLDRLDRPEEAVAALEIAVRDKPGDAQIHFRLGNLYHRLGDDGKAIAAYEKAIKKDRNFLRAYYNMGAVLVEMERYDEALAAYETALAPIEEAFVKGEEVDAAHARAYQNLGAIYFQKREWRRALDAYGKALRLDPSLPGTLYNQGYAYFQLQQFDAAAEVYRRALASDPNLPLAYLHLGQIDLRRGRTEAAVRWLELGRERLTGSDRLTALAALAPAYLELGRSTDAEAAYRAVLAASPRDYPALLALGRLLRKSGRQDEARQLLEQARQLYPDRVVAAVELAALARGDGRQDEEKELYESILKTSAKDPELWPVRLSLAFLLVRQGALAEARAHLEILARLEVPAGSEPGLYPGPDERRMIATIEATLGAQEGDLAAARRQLRSLVESAPSFTPAVDVLAVLDAAAGDLPAAVDALASSLERLRGGPLESLARANLGQSLWLAKQAAAARPHLEAAAAGFPEWTSVRAALGEVALALADRQQAMTHLGAAAALCASDAAKVEVSLAAGSAFVAQTIRGTGGRRQPAALCDRLAASLGFIEVEAALLALVAVGDGASSFRAVRQLADQALTRPLEPATHAVALFVRGTAHLGLGSDQAAQRDLAAALGGDLASPLREMGQNNLGIARARLGDTDGARRSFESARASDGSLEASLNLGILLDDHVDRPADAVVYYREYLAGKGRRQAEVAAWVERLEKIY